MKLLIDSAVAYSMDEVDMVFVGADGVVESGGIINLMGTYQIALVAKSMNKPVYVAAESYKVNELSSLIQHSPNFSCLARTMIFSWTALFQIHLNIIIIYASYCSLLDFTHWIKKTWPQLCALSILVYRFHQRWRLKHLHGTTLLHII